MTLVLVGCSGGPTAVSPAEEEAFDTDGASLSRYHFFLEKPFAQGLRHTGFLVGLEKSPHKAVRGPSSIQAFDSSRFELPSVQNFQTSEADAEIQRRYFRRTLNDGKVVFVSHVIRYGVAAGSTEFSTELLHSAYSQTGFSPRQQKCPANAELSPYEAGWSSLTCLENEMRTTLRDAKKRGKPFSHILLMAMGWNNDQVVSVANFNSIITHTKEAAARNNKTFNPLVVGITWPSVWGGGFGSEVFRTAGHLASYSTRARDADEIGFTYANELLNSQLPKLEEEFGIRTVAIGHSFGARLLTRAYASAAYLKSNTLRTEGSSPLIIGLQPAFSANRFLPDQSSVANIVPGIPSEGGPYQNFQSLSGQLAITWSDRDFANPLAQYLTGARHVGGKPGFSAVSGRSDRFVFSTVGQNEIERNCSKASRTKRVHFINASRIVRSHSDITNANVGYLIWNLVACDSRVAG